MNLVRVQRAPQTRGNNNHVLSGERARRGWEAVKSFISLKWPLRTKVFRFLFKMVGGGGGCVRGYRIRYPTCGDVMDVVFSR